MAQPSGGVIWRHLLTRLRLRLLSYTEVLKTQMPTRMDPPLVGGSQKCKSAEKRVLHANHARLLLPCPVLEEAICAPVLISVVLLKVLATSRGSLVEAKGQEPNMYDVGYNHVSIPWFGQLKLLSHYKSPA